MPRLEGAGGDFGQHGGVEHVIALAYQRDFQAGVAQEELLQALRRTHTAEPATQNDHAPLGRLGWGSSGLLLGPKAQVARYQNRKA